MAWNNQGGGGPWGGGPWGGSGGGRGSGGPPDLEELLKRGQDRFKNMMPGGLGGGRGILLVVAAIVALWLVFGSFYRVQPGHQGVELLFGRYVKTTSPGLNIWFPPPIGEVLTPNVEQTNQIDIGFRSSDVGPVRGRTAGARDVLEESLMLTGDQNMIDIDFTVQWRIKDAAAFLFNLQNPQYTIKLAAESAMREIVGQMELERAYTTERQALAQRTAELMQQILDSYSAGVTIVGVEMQAADPPQEVIDDFNDVQRARQDRERLQNEAQRYRNDIVPRAKGEASRITEDALAYKERVVKDAEGEASRFNSVYDSYQTARDVTVKRLYLEGLQEVLRSSNKVLIDENASGSGQGVVPYLPLNELQRRSAPIVPGAPVQGAPR